MPLRTTLETREDLAAELWGQRLTIELDDPAAISEAMGDALDLGRIWAVLLDAVETLDERTYGHLRQKVAEHAEHAPDALACCEVGTELTLYAEPAVSITLVAFGEFLVPTFAEMQARRLAAEPPAA
jgi:hypothetical protein